MFIQDFKPHIFIVAEEAYRNVQGQVEPVDQSLVVSGESGAGKVCRVKLCIYLFLASLCCLASLCFSPDMDFTLPHEVLRHSGYLVTEVPAHGGEDRETSAGLEPHHGSLW